VPVADVLNAAVAEIEDYVRVDVITEATDAVAGTAVNDVIHLLAELAENATTFSPPNTRVEVRGDAVGNGFVVEIEDRGLGMPAEEIAALNERLARPPEFDLANSDQLGLFVAARLAQRHEIRISLRQSPFGGTTAIVLLPLTIMVSASGAAWEPAFGLTGRHRRSDAVPELGSVPAPRPAPPLLDRPVLDRPVLEPPTLDPPAPRRTKPAASGWFSRVQAPRDIHPGMAGMAGMADGAGGAGGSRPVLPRRVRQESMAPQLRDKFGPGAASDGLERHPAPPWPSGPAAEEPSARSPEEAGSMLSALQDGWERARLQTHDEDW